MWRRPRHRAFGKRAGKRWALRYWNPDLDVWDWPHFVWDTFDSEVRARRVMKKKAARCSPLRFEVVEIR